MATISNPRVPASIQSSLSVDHTENPTADPSATPVTAMTHPPRTPSTPATSRASAAGREVVEATFGSNSSRSIRLSVEPGDGRRCQGVEAG